MEEGRQTQDREARGRSTAPGALGALRVLGAPRALLRRGRTICSRWWTARTVRFRKVARTVVLLAATCLVSLCVGVVTATASSPVGPHRAQWSTTLDSTASLDLGPLGQIALDSPAGILGVRVVLGEVAGQAEPVVGSQDALGEALTSDGAAYVSLITHPELTIERGLRALVDDALRRAGLLESIMLCLVAAGRLATGGRLRDAVRQGLARTGASGLLTVTGAVAVVALILPALRPEAVTGHRLPILVGTPMEQARVSGRIGDIVQAYGGRVTTFLADNTSFYTAAHANLWAAWTASEQVDGVTDVTAADGVVDVDQVARAAASAAPAETSGAPSRGPSTAAAPGSSSQPPTTAARLAQSDPPAPWARLRPNSATGVCAAKHTRAAFVAMSVWKFMQLSSAVSSSWHCMIGPVTRTMGSMGKTIVPSRTASISTESLIVLKYARKRASKSGPPAGAVSEAR